MKTFKLEENKANALLQYLATRPYGDVYQLVNALQTLKECICKEEVKPKVEVKEEKK